jgi:pimeloyl-ACP methyl ester carboxylesterase
MATATTAASDLFREEAGAGEPLVLVHGSWSETLTWSLAMPGLAGALRVIAYDRLGHGQSAPAPAGPLARRRHEDDLAALIETVAGGRAHVAGNSYGGSIALGLATRRPELFRSVSAHEPPLVGIATRDAIVEQAAKDLEAVGGIVEKGDPEAAARHFVENVVIGPGAWPMLPPEIHQAMVRNAPAFAAELRDPDWANADLEALAELEIPILLTHGDAILPWFAPIMETLAGAAPQAELVTLEGAGHVPHQTHAGEYAALISSFALDTKGTKR